MTEDDRTEVQRLLAAGKRIAKRRSLLEEYGAPEVVGSPTKPFRSHSDRIFNQACSMARQDEVFRRGLLAALKASGKGKLGQPPPLGEHAHIQAAFEAALRILVDSGKRPTKKAAIDMLVAGPFSERSPEALDKLLRATSPKKPGTK